MQESYDERQGRSAYFWETLENRLESVVLDAMNVEGDLVSRED